MNENKAIKDKAIYLTGSLMTAPLFIGEFMQLLALNGYIDYNFLVGHLSDFSLSSLMTGTVFSKVKGKSKLTEIIGSLLPATLLSIREYCPVLPFEDVVDPLDVVSYWMGAWAFFLGVEYFSDKQFQGNVNTYILNSLIRT